MSRLFDHTPETGTTRLFHYDNETDRFGIETIQDVEGIVEENKADLNDCTSLDRFGEMRRVASIPLTVYMDLQARGIIDDQAAMKRWLNDPDNRFFRTFRGKI